MTSLGAVAQDKQTAMTRAQLLDFKQNVSAFVLFLMF